MLDNKKVFIAGHNGMVGKAFNKKIQDTNCEILTVDRSEIDLMNQKKVFEWMESNKPDFVIICAARVGGIQANNSYPVDFLYNNLSIATNLIHASFINKVEKLLFLGSSCIYPKLAPQPIAEDSLLTGALEPTNEWYALAKIAGIKLCKAYRKQYDCNFISVMPTNLYGPGDNYNLETSHVIPALIRKCYEAKLHKKDAMEVWGTGLVKREFMHVDDLADAMLFLLKNYSEEDHINVGAGKDITIKELANLICNIIEFKGELIFDNTKPDGTPKKLLNSSRINELGWRPKISIKDGLEKTINDYIKSIDS